MLAEGTEIRHVLRRSLLWFHATVVVLLTFFPYKLRSRTLCAQWTYNVTLAHLLVCFPLCHMFSTCVLVYPWSCFTCPFTLPFWTVNSSVLMFLAYAYSFCLVDLSPKSLFLDSDSYSDLFTFTAVCTCIS